jgi:glycosyltransferase involved in cell wall biosynthesis
MSNLMNFSIVIPLFNKNKSIGKTIQSVQKQTYTAFELVIVDDGSTDGSYKIVESIADQRIRLIKKSNGGVSSARNKGIKEAKFNYITFLDADDFWEPNYLEEMAYFIDLFPGAGLYGCAFDEVNKKRIENRDFGLDDGYKGYIQDFFTHSIKHQLYWTSATIINKELVSNKGFFDERINIGEDLDLWFRIGYYHKVAFYNKILAHYNTGAENRGMMKKHPYSRSIHCYTSKYHQMEQDNPEFKYFINLFRILRIPEVFLDYDIGKKEIKAYMKTIDIQGQNWKHSYFIKMPFLIQRITISLWKKYRGL